MSVTVRSELGTSTAAEIANRVGQLYTLPAVAREVLELAKDPNVDNAKLKECIQQDPALTVRVLRVVNSSLFGLSGQVNDLNQALALLGVKPLKMLVLGFTLPEALFLDIARDQLEWYWKSTLIRAVAAREISEKMFSQPGDEPFLAGLLQDIGILALLGQIGDPYAELVGEVIADRSNLIEVETQLLGFDHTELTARLLELWSMPCSLSSAISEPKNRQRLARSIDNHAPLARTLHLAELLAQLVGQCRLSVLPELLETGETYGGMDKDMLDSLVRSLDPKVRQLATVLSIPTETSEYVKTLAAAHHQLADMTEVMIIDEISARKTLEEQVSFGTSRRLRTAVAEYLALPISTCETLPCEDLDSHSGDQNAEIAIASDSLDENSVARSEEVCKRVEVAVSQARAARESVSLALFTAQVADKAEFTDIEVVDQLLRAACRRTMSYERRVEQASDTGLVWILLGRDRQDAVALANDAIKQVRAAAPQLLDASRHKDYVFAAGVASVDMPTKNFPALALLDAADRCLAGALVSGGGTKSLVVS